MTVPLRALSAVSTALLLGLICNAPVRAQAQGQDKNATTDKTTAKGSLSFGEEPIDPNQPLKPDFIINVVVQDEPEPSGNYTVDPAGNVGIRYSGITTPVMVKGLTPTQAADAIAKLLKAYVKNPKVTVTIIS